MSKQGKRGEGVFTSSPSLESIQLILAGSAFIIDSGLFALSPRKRVAFLKSAQSILEFLLGAKKGKLNFISKNKH